MERDYLLDLTGSDYSLNVTPPLKKNASSFSSLVGELFDANSDDAIEVDIELDFAKDSKSTEEQLQRWQSPADPSKTPEWQQQSITASCVPCTLEHPVQMTQQPQQPPREGATPQCVPHLPGEVLPSSGGLPVPALPVPALPVFRMLAGSGSAGCETARQLHILDGAETCQLLQELSSEPPPPAMVDITLQTQDFGQTPQAVLLESASIVEDFDMDRKIKFIQEAVKLYHNQGAAISSNGKVQVHEVVLVLLLAEQCDVDFLTNILTFCTEEGVETGSVSDNFLARNTKLVGLIWQRIKGNRNANYDTFARAMRVCRERQRDFFDYLDAGKSAKKRIYKLGPKCRKELSRMKKVLQGLGAGS